MVFVYFFKGYKVSYSKEAQKALKKIDPLYADKIKHKFEEMVNDSPNLDIKKLQGQEASLFRLRVGVYRAVFEVHQSTITILVITVDHRKDAYTRF